jgi:hypothetical protein
MVDSGHESASVKRQRQVSAAVAELLREGSTPGSGRGAFSAVVRGACMEPRLRDGQRVRVLRRRWALPGDIVAFERGVHDPGLAVHRLLGARPSRSGWVLVTQADNEPLPDPAVACGRLLGVAQVPVSLRERARALQRLAPAVAAPLAAALRRARRSWVPMSPSGPK